MPTLVESPTVIPPAGHPPKLIREHIGRVNTAHTDISIAHMQSPPGWTEPGQTPSFREFTVVLRGAIEVDYVDQAGETLTLTVTAGQSVVTEPGEWVRYRTPRGAEYLAVCTPAFSLDTVHRDASEGEVNP